MCQMPTSVVGYCIKPCNRPPTATNLYRDDCDWCANPFQFRMNWTFSDPDNDTQGAKQVQVSPNSSFTTITFDSGKVSNDIPAYSIPATGSGLQFNNTYYWRVKVWDPAGLSSSWITSSQTLNTPPNEYPTPAFTANPPRPAKNQSTLFADDSTGATNIAKWSWTFQDANPSNLRHHQPFKEKPDRHLHLRRHQTSQPDCLGR